MSISRSSINDYPEHLNPFYEGDQKARFWKIGKVKRSSSFGETLRNTLLLKSFRGKKKKEKEVSKNPIELRTNNAGVYRQAVPVHRQTLPTIYSPSSIRTSTPVPLPRSRFSERVPKPIDSQVIENSPNPFDEEEEQKVTKPHIKRRKRKAPLPPGLGGSSQNVSNWSLTSDCTDLSAYSDTEIITDPDVSACIANITKEIERMTENEDDNNTKATCDEQSYSEIPDLVVSSIDSVQLEKSQSKSAENCTDENCNVLSDMSIPESMENIGPDIVHHASHTETDDVNEEKKYFIVSASIENLHKADSLTNLINSININIIDKCSVNTEPDLVNDATCNESMSLDKDEEKRCSSQLETMNKVDSLTNLINSIDIEHKELEENNFELKQVDSLTNIINSINFTDNEAFEGKDSAKKCGIEDYGILNCDSEKVETKQSDDESNDEKSAHKIIENNYHT